jgi:ubiquinol-cytochrome c reductase iron-sulfur subunit
VSRVRRWFVSGIVLLLGRGAPRVERETRIVPAGAPSPRAELAVFVLLGLATLSSVGFIVVYAFNHLAHQTQYLGLALGLALAFLAAGCVVVSKRLVVQEEIEEDYPPVVHPAAVDEVEQIVEESGSRFTRRRLLILGAGGAGAALGAAAITPTLSLGPFLQTDPFYATPWRRGLRLVDELGRPMLADEIEESTFYTAYPEHANREQMGAPLVVVRLSPSALHLPDGRGGWAPHGILAYSKICTHAGCAINLYRAPLFAPAEPKPALVCPCHYSTFDVARGGAVIFGPAGRALPQLPLAIGAKGELRAAGNFSGPVGPSWWGIRMHGAKGPGAP